MCLGGRLEENQNNQFKVGKIVKDIKILRKGKNAQETQNLREFNTFQRGDDPRREGKYSGIKELLEKYHITQSQLAQEFGYDRSAFHHILSGKQRVSNKLFMRLLENWLETQMGLRKRKV